MKRLRRLAMRGNLTGMLSEIEVELDRLGRFGEILKDGIRLLDGGGAVEPKRPRRRLTAARKRRLTRRARAEAAPEPTAGTLAAQILGVLRANGGEMSTKAITQALLAGGWTSTSKAPENVVGVTIRALVQHGLVRHPSRLRWKSAGPASGKLSQTVARKLRQAKALMQERASA